MKQLSACLFLMALIYSHSVPVQAKDSLHDQSEVVQNIEDQSDFDQFYVIVIGLNKETNTIENQCTISLKAYAELFQYGGSQMLQEDFPGAAFILVRHDPKNDSFCYIDPEEILASLPTALEEEMSLKYILKKSATVFLGTCEVAMLLTLWTTRSIVIPGGKIALDLGAQYVQWTIDSIIVPGGNLLIEQSSKLMAWLRGSNFDQPEIAEEPISQN